MPEIIHIGKKQFEKKEVEKLLTFLNNFTHKYDKKLNNLLNQISYNPSLYESLDEKVSKLWDEWSEKIIQLGGEPRQFWVVEFRSYHDFYYTWNYPESKILYLRKLKSSYRLEDRFKIPVKKNVTSIIKK